MAWGSLIGAGLSLFGAKEQGDAARAANAGNLQAKTNARRDLSRARGLYDRNSQLGLGYYMDALDEAGRSEAMAAGELTRGMEGTTRRIMDMGRQDLASLGGDYASRGLYSSTLLDQARTGVKRRTARSLTDAESDTAFGRASLARSAGASRIGALSQLGRAYERRGSGLADFSTRMAGLEAGVQHVVAPGIAESYGRVGGFLGDAADGFTDWWRNRGSGGGDVLGPSKAGGGR